MKKQKIHDLLKFNVVLLMVLVSTILCYSNVNADDTNLGRTPDGVFPFQENDIVMEAEDITVDLDKNTVECIFVFHNTGKDKDILMGFPGKIRVNEYDDVFNAGDLEIKNFKTYIKGKELPVSREKSLKKDELEHLNMQDYSEFFTFTVPFKADEKITIRNTYDFVPTYDSLGSVYCGYILETGAMWKGNIGSAKVTFKLGKIKPYHLEKLNPGGFKFEGNNIVWTRNNFEPTYNLQLTYNGYRFNSEYLTELAESDNNLRLNLIQKMDNYNKVKKLADEGKTKELISLYNKAIKENDSIMALYIASFVPSNKIVKQDTKFGNLEVKKSEYDENYYIVNCNTLGEEPVSRHITISHIENGKVINDVSETVLYGFGTSDLIPGVEYNITFSITDWLGKTQSKTMKYEVPKQSAILTENKPQISDTTSSVSATNSSSDIAKTSDAIALEQNTNEKEKVADDSSANNSNNSKEQLVDGPVRGINLKVVVGAIIGVILIGISIASVILLRRKEQD